MNVRELIEELEKIENKELPVVWQNNYGRGGDCCSTEYHYHYDPEPDYEDVDSVYPMTRTVGRYVKKQYIQENETVIYIGD
ncbi:hypothetical protein SEA_MOAB_172 [Streptomyces phage Moab]|nr:hypothetical protein SEA_MOAB_172 [Streptomyces phage Moab]